MIKFKISADRFATVCNVIEYLNASANDQDTVIRIAPRFMVDEQGEYIVKAVFDDDGDIDKFEGLDTAFAKLALITPKRLEKLIPEFSEAARAIVNPPKGEG